MCSFIMSWFVLFCMLSDNWGDVNELGLFLIMYI